MGMVKLSKSVFDLVLQTVRDSPLDFCNRVASSLIDDRRQENAEGIERGVGAELASCHDVYFPVNEGFFCVLHGELLSGFRLTNLSLAQQDHIASVLFSQELCVFRLVCENEWDCKSSHHGQSAINLKEWSVDEIITEIVCYSLRKSIARHAIRQFQVE